MLIHPDTQPRTGAYVAYSIIAYSTVYNLYLNNSIKHLALGHLFSWRLNIYQLPNIFFYISKAYRNEISDSFFGERPILLSTFWKQNRETSFVYTLFTNNNNNNKVSRAYACIRLQKSCSKLWYCCQQHCSSGNLGFPELIYSIQKKKKKSFRKHEDASLLLYVPIYGSGQNYQTNMICFLKLWDSFHLTTLTVHLHPVILNSCHSASAQFWPIYSQCECAAHICMHCIH